jgi:hypothetical protein
MSKNSSLTYPDISHDDALNQFYWPTIAFHHVFQPLGSLLQAHQFPLSSNLLAVSVDCIC